MHTDYVVILPQDDARSVLYHYKTHLQVADILETCLAVNIQSVIQFLHVKDIALLEIYSQLREVYGLLVIYLTWVWM